MSRRDTLQHALGLKFVSGVHGGLYYAYAEARPPPRARLCAHGRRNKLALDFCSPLCGIFDCLGRSAWLTESSKRHTVV
jgi:rubredoxin